MGSAGTRLANAIRDYVEAKIEYASATDKEHRQELYDDASDAWARIAKEIDAIAEGTP